MASVQETVVARLDDLSEAKPLRVQVGEADVLLIKVGGRIYAVGAHCPHWHGPLEEGLLNGHRLTCPQHHACFDLETGAVVDAPARRGPGRHEVRVDGQDVIVSLRHEPAMSPRIVGTDPRTFVIVGAGAAASRAVETLHREGFGGRLVVISPDVEDPVDRPNLSKDFLRGTAEPGWIPLWDEKTVQRLGIERLTESVTQVDVVSRRVELSGGRVIQADGILLATGARPRRLGVPGEDLAGVYTLRSFRDARAIAATAQRGHRALVVGAGFVGMEVASSLRTRGLEVAVVAPEHVPFASVLGDRIGGMIKDLHTEQGVEFHLRRTVARLFGTGRVQAAELDDGTRLMAELVVVGVGVEPCTDVVSDALKDAAGGLIVDDHLRVGDGVYAAGDIASFPHAGSAMRVEHWRAAEQQAVVAARNMLGRDVAYQDVPFFWTTHYDMTLSMVGQAAQWDRILIDGELSRRRFLAFYLAGEAVQAVAGVDRAKELLIIERLMRLGKLPPAGALLDQMPDWTGVLAWAEGA